MPISTSAFGDERDDRYGEYAREDEYATESMEFPALTAAQAETFLKRLGGGVSEKNRVVEGIGWKAEISEQGSGVTVTFRAHDELMDDLLRRFEEWVERGA